MIDAAAGASENFHGALPAMFAPCNAEGGCGTGGAQNHWVMERLQGGTGKHAVLLSDGAFFGSDFCMGKIRTSGRGADGQAGRSGELIMVGAEGIEPSTCRLRVGCSTN